MDTLWCGDILCLKHAGIHWKSSRCKTRAESKKNSSIRLSERTRPWLRCYYRQLFHIVFFGFRIIEAKQNVDRDYKTAATRDVPKEMLPSKDREQYSSRLSFSDQTRLVSYVPKKRCSMILLSTQHKDDTTCGQENNFKLQVVLDYNETKGAVDNLDKMVTEYASYGRKTKRCPLTLFFNLMDISSVNAFILFLTKFPTIYGTKSHGERRLFLKELGLELVKPLIEQRLSSAGSVGIQRNVAFSWLSSDRSNWINQPLAATRHRQSVIGIRSMCPRNKDRKYRTVCDECSDLACEEHCIVHRLWMCIDCEDNDDISLQWTTFASWLL